MNIIRLNAQNVKRLSAVQITPQGNLVVIGGKNGAGKSSVLDSIMYALAGGDSLPKMPVRKGQAKAKVRLDLGDYIVSRTFTAEGGTSLTITGREGVKFPSPQGLLDSLTGKLSFDPLDFARQKPAQQAETLRALVGLDLRALDQQEARLFDQRTEANRLLKAEEATLARLPVPAEGQLRIPQSVADVMKELEDAIHKNEAADDQRESIQSAEAQVNRLKGERAQLQEQMDKLQSLIRATDNAIRVSTEQLDILKQSPPPANIDLAPIRVHCANIEAENRRVSDAQQYDHVSGSVTDARNKAEKLDVQLGEVRAKRAQAIRDAKYPIPGLALEATGVSMGGIPFEQCSSAEQLRVSVAIGLALNPKLRVLLIRDGSLLDEQSLALVAGMAAEAKAQVWIERVETDGNVSVIIEDGHVKGQEPAFQPEMPSPLTDPGPPPDPPAEGAWQAPAATKPASRATKGSKPATLNDCPRCGAPMAIGRGGKMVCTAECGPSSDPAEPARQAAEQTGAPEQTEFPNEDDVPTP